MEAYLQSCEDGVDEELVFFPGAKAEGPSVDHQWLKGEAVTRLIRMKAIQ
jgi:hypothetical protein